MTPELTEFQTGLDYLKSQVKNLPKKPGVYRMFDADGQSLYVGKAKWLSNRVTSYTQPNRLTNRLLRMVAETRHLEITVTHSEVEALLLESNLIKQLKPRYNILLKDDKSFAYIMVTEDHAFPQLTKHRGKRLRKASYYGPFASAGAVNKTIASLSRAFLLRNCTDSIFFSRTRPCLQYQIKRCTAPCVNKVDKTEYDKQVEAAKKFLSGHSDEVQRHYATEMQKASDILEFETAAIWRNRITALTAIQANQDINLKSLQDADIIAVAISGGICCVQVFFVRNGSNYGNTAFFPRINSSEDVRTILSAFIGQFYSDKIPANLILVSELPKELKLLQSALSQQTGNKITISRPERGDRRKIMEMAIRNAEEAIARKLADTASQRRLLDALTQSLELDEVPERIEIYDNSHIQGTHAVGAMVVATADGFAKSAYRKFNMRNEGAYAVHDGDDFAMMRQMIHRRFDRALKEDPNREMPTWPDLLLIDGGRGQINAVYEVLDELGINDITAIGVSKGPDRNAGREQFHKRNEDSFTLQPDSPAMHYLQRLRDEAHRFAIGSHRTRRTNAQFKNPLDGVPGIGAKRKKALLNHFGSARSVTTAGIQDLQAVEGISSHIAQHIYDWFHSQNNS
ncbi:excinuclease ABC subunit UvrC [Alphaproteobacteria bacterium]|nr:excinuclease ABC subunit UvrC [Alphaproteobacteria bacterium]